MNGSSICDGGVVPLGAGGTIAYQVHGRSHSGVPVLLIRPLGGSIDLWGAFRVRLARQFRVISFDLPGTGRSTDDPHWSGTRRLSKDCLKVLDHIQVPSANVFGLSLGGMIGTWLAVLAPRRVASLCVASAPERGLELAQMGFGQHLTLAACFASSDINVEANLVQYVLSSQFRATHPDRVREITDLVRAKPSSRRALIKHLLAALRHDVRKELKCIETPTLVLSGEYDEVLGSAAPRALANAISNAQFAVIRGAGHDLSLEQPITTADCVCNFFARTAISRGSSAGGYSPEARS